MRALGAVTRPQQVSRSNKGSEMRGGKKKGWSSAQRVGKYPRRTKVKKPGLGGQIQNYTTSTNKAASSFRRPQVNDRVSTAQKLNAKMSTFIMPLLFNASLSGSSKARPQHLARYDRDVTRRKKMAPRVQRGKKPGEG